VEAIFAAGQQSHVALLAGWNADEGSYKSIFETDAPSPENFVTKIRALYGPNAEAILKLYPATNVAETKRSARDLAGDRFTGFATWKWLEMQVKTGQAPVYRFQFEDTLPFPAGTATSADNEPVAPHASEIEFVFQVLSSRDLPWRPQDEKVSDLMGCYWTNFAKTGDPNGEGLPHWPAYAPPAYEVMHLNADSHAAPDAHRPRYEFLNQIH
jgi:para-nitrobenzyl esterase